MKRPMTNVEKERDGLGFCVHCCQRKQENGNWCWLCSDRAATGEISWDDRPETR